MVTADRGFKRAEMWLKPQQQSSLATSHLAKKVCHFIVRCVAVAPERSSLNMDTNLLFWGSAVSQPSASFQIKRWDHGEQKREGFTTGFLRLLFFKHSLWIDSNLVNIKQYFQSLRSLKHNLWVHPFEVLIWCIINAESFKYADLLTSMYVYDILVVFTVQRKYQVCNNSVIFAFIVDKCISFMKYWSERHWGRTRAYRGRGRGESSLVR